MDYKNMFRLDGRTVVVTGGCGYLGKEIVKGLCAFGANVYVVDYKINEIAELNCDEYAGRIHYIECDLNDTQAIKDTLKEAAGVQGVIHNLITMAANLGAGVVTDVETMDDECWKKGIEGTIGYTFRTVREVIPYMKKCSDGSIVNIGSLYAVGAPDPRTYFDTPFNSTPNYGAGKAATVEFTKYCASYLAKYGIRANSVSPGSFPHEKVQENQLFKDRLAYKTMLGRIGYPEDLVGAMVYLLSSASKYVTGINVMVDGGQTAW
ncbi:SDR family oxidoreductase [Bacteroides thetaiotaomicron]|jgi:NAD(P)-dependent dehydrogenase (short-subunit alcohol dehydrogenase family)|uniref:SDR family oxidoreductase n=1 Tax=Bacteroides thetaiotaomicron TaxID=818 RepID=UPI00189CB481|nr:SDR family oxidoreductase [Bacteroides thetaiotaomicron]MCE9018153.1 SDR family oxidoreductase [Bacteroides thetaiotaomicron]MCS2395491.1 SDR family oxidoreductase [Bacteroides thetaiotaomicron]MDC2007620.1 SDR family oxidoreductase [Bacteroides thetaiotaomicron]MDC2022329.1 SDR family oxidoreductase [Bacteroides thetaiotaomicron]MDC2024606.1 SDR family oxidoreductase [Bacteroides thetaiotaomicron]